MKTIKYIGTQERWPELATTGRQSSWSPGQIEERADAEADPLIATGLFTTNLESGRLSVTEAQMVEAAIAAGMLDVYAGTVLPTVNGVRASSVTLNAGTSNTVQRARITLAPPTDTIGAQRLLVPTEETYTIELGQTITIPVPDGAGTALVAHALGISNSTTYPGGGYCIGDTETDLSDALTNDVRLEWLSDEIAKVEVTLEVGVTTQRAFLVVLGWTR